VVCIADTARRQLLERLRVEITEPALLEQALTHRSAAGRHNERLEFLGDAVLEMVITDWLYRRFPDAPEGDLTRLRARLVRKETLASVARELDLGAALTLGGGELKSGGRYRDGILADAFEAVLGALYLDQGLGCCETLLKRVMGPRLDNSAETARDKDPKTRLQEWLQSRALALPTYDVVEVSGADHDQQFLVECRVEASHISVRGRGSSRRRAEQDAAQQVIEHLRNGGAAP
jgi:ribonuclease-3